MLFSYLFHIFHPSCWKKRCAVKMDIWRRGAPHLNTRSRQVDKILILCHNIVLEFGLGKILPNSHDFFCVFINIREHLQQVLYCNISTCLKVSIDQWNLQKLRLSLKGLYTAVEAIWVGKIAISQQNLLPNSCFWLFQLPPDGSIEHAAQISHHLWTDN